MSKYALPCFKCSKPLENVFPDIDNQPHKGTTFETHGHYGSTYFDPMWENRWLEINICDECLIENENLINEFEKQHKTVDPHEIGNPD